MSTFGFILHFHMPTGKIIPETLNEDGIILSLPGAGGQATMKRLPPRSNTVPSSPERYEIRGSSFQSMQSCTACGKRLKQALAVIGCDLDCGVDVGNDRSTSGASKHLKDMFRDQFNVQLRDNVHGLDVFDEDLPVRRIEISGTLSVTSRVQDFVQALYAKYIAGSFFTEKKAFALSLYNSLLFEPSTPTRFLNLITVVEILSQRLEVSKDAMNLLGKMHEILRESPLPEGELHSLTNGLHNLKRISIGEACKRLVTRHLGAEQGEYFSQCYKIRSDLVHSGKTATPEKMNSTELGNLVRKVLLAELEST